MRCVRGSDLITNRVRRLSRGLRRENPNGERPTMGIKEDAEALGEDPEVRRRAIEALPPFDPNGRVYVDIPVRPKNSPPPRGGSGDKKPSPGDKSRSPASGDSPPAAPPPGGK